MFAAITECAKESKIIKLMLKRICLQCHKIKKILKKERSDTNWNIEFKAIITRCLKA